MEKMKKFDEESMEEMEEHMRFMVEEKRELRENEKKWEKVKWRIMSKWGGLLGLCKWELD